ncbi:MAG TPA: hypothetical protein VNJ10_01295, partial [Sphingomonas sp.]|nr:hypothetical protein [Sphingomonas sp.]
TASTFIGILNQQARDGASKILMPHPTSDYAARVTPPVLPPQWGEQIRPTRSDIYFRTRKQFRSYSAAGANQVDASRPDRRTSAFG